MLLHSESEQNNEKIRIWRCNQTKQNPVFPEQNKLSKPGIARGGGRTSAVILLIAAKKSGESETAGEKRMKP